MLKIGKFFLMLAFSLQVAAGQELYVSPSGDDGNSGTREQPLATLTGARDRIRELRSRGAITDTLFVRILPGTYTLMEPFVLTVEDAGSATSPVIYTSAEADKRPLFCGGIETAQFEVVNPVCGGICTETRLGFRFDSCSSTVNAVFERRPTGEIPEYPEDRYRYP